MNNYLNLVSGDVLPFSITENGTYITQNIDFQSLSYQISNNMVSSIFRIMVLYPDEAINYEIPREDIKLGGSWNENYQNGQRRALSFGLYNESGKYTPDINSFWSGTRLRLDMGLILPNNQTIWFQKGIFVITQITANNTPTGKEVQISASDKFSLFEDSTGRIDSTYEIPVGTEIKSIIQNILLTDMGNGAPLDSQKLIYHSAFEGKTTQCTISKSAGDTLGSILLDLATQLSAEIFYNAYGCLTVVPINEVTTDQDKPLIYEFDADKGDLSQLDFSFDMNQIINKIVVIGSSTNGGVYKYIAVNDDTASPLCWQRIGYRTGSIINDSNITSNVLAKERAEYELRQQLILKSSTSANVLFNPLLEVNNLISISDTFFNLKYERFLLNSISCSLDYNNQMSISFSNLKNLPFVTR